MCNVVVICHRGHMGVPIGVLTMGSWNPADAGIHSKSNSFEPSVLVDVQSHVHAHVGLVLGVGWPSSDLFVPFVFILWYFIILIILFLSCQRWVSWFYHSVIPASHYVHMKWKGFRRYCPLARRIRQSLTDSSRKGPVSRAFDIISQPELFISQTAELPVF